ncbi:hypothetical protein QQY66_28420 [Streptomyces sp. DG2A-72]|uniref:hypothetical protein n=1 Tax=Streptomyces sp. DG2A-72 TaxID=3051386 RepID=UPI00265B80E3|nr:hypothetical protein [Streptomyces sp. DG2A-72]MDO0935404.1 hypothetical protein [Streptomyces sp. DG2A-72]
MRTTRVLAACGAALVMIGGAASLAVAGSGPEVGLAYHGAASMAAGRVDVRFTPRNHGASAVPDASVRLLWSEPLADRQALPGGCARSGERAVVCRVGALAAKGVGEPIGLRVQLREAPSEVLLEIGAVADGGRGGGSGSGDSDPQRVLVLDTGDEYYF